jgi:large subunit ribosomal protein L17
MRHGKKNNHLGRTDSHRKAMLANMASSLIKHKRITTTLAKAKALRMYVEPMITKSKNDTTHSRRIVFSYLQDKETVTELFRDVAAKVANRPGGYTRIIKLNNRLGDNAEMALIELVDYNEVYGKEADTADKKTTRRGRSRGKKADAPAAATETAEATEAPATEAPAAEPATETEGEQA